MQAAHFLDDFVPRAKIKVIGVGKNDLRANLFKKILCHAFDGRRRPDRHEDWGFYNSVGGYKLADPRVRARTCGYDLKIQFCRHPKTALSSSHEQVIAGREPEFSFPFPQGHYPRVAKPIFANTTTIQRPT